MQHHSTIVDIASSVPPSPLSPSRRAGGPRLSLDTSQERLQNITIIKDGDKSYLKLFSPDLVESPVSYLSANQLFDDKKLWENGPDEVLKKQLERENTEVFKEGESENEEYVCV
ncbi:hypothetical protein BG011_010036 [Mortierella polycephala]|uniref:Uncharacterized protein n=1 Tax=Mortierella polycephala TaxID=41804 RepID=A0A9P6PME4_9FUNG|nr:hypothetical protein BG011_010036 [Mortierella polycephala]